MAVLRSSDACETSRWLGVPESLRAGGSAAGERTMNPQSLLLRMGFRRVAPRRYRTEQQVSKASARLGVCRLVAASGWQLLATSSCWLLAAAGYMQLLGW